MIVYNNRNSKTISYNNHRNMSRYNASRTSRRTPYCKVCHDAGKSRAEYTSHFLRETPSRNSRVVCPTLLATVCRKCGEGGHMSSYCPQRTRPRRTARVQSHTDRDGFQTRNMEASWRLSRKLATSPAQSDTQSIATTESSFSALSLDDEDDSNSEFPALNPQEFTWKPSTATSTKSRPTLKTGQTWAQVADVESHSPLPAWIENMEVETPTSPFVPFSGSVSNWSDDSTPRSPFESGRSEIIMQEILDRKDNKKRWGDD